jgi:hypothetical protein
MKTRTNPPRIRLSSLPLLLACAAFIALASNVRAEDTSTNSTAGKVAAPAKAAPPAAAPVKPKHELTGAELYSMHCNRCHPERYPTERTAAQWKTILLHMRVRANLPAEQARTILKYLQENSGR